MFFGVAEPVMHYLSPPVGTPETVAAAKEAMRLTFFHWGLHAWAIYAIVALILAFFLLQSFRAIAGNRPLFILCIANLCTLGAFNVKLAIQVYYTQYVLNDPILLSYMGFFSMGCMF